MPASQAPLPDSFEKGDKPMPSSFDDDLEFWDEGRIAKLWRRMKEDPLILVGLGLTTWAVWNASKSMRRGNKTETNKYFRYRVYAQGFTLLIMCVGGAYWKEDREKRKQMQGLLGEKRAQEKREAWIRELELRDEEERREREAKKSRIEAIRKSRASEGAGAESSSAMDDADLLRLAQNTRFLGSAMMLFRWRSQH